MADTGSNFNGAYCTNNSMTCFVVDHGIFVTTYTREAMSTIGCVGLTRKYFYVPFFNEDYPKYQKSKWLRLREAAHESYYRDYENDYAKWCDEHDISKLGEDILEHCFKMPRERVSAKHLYFKTTYYPAYNKN